MVNAVHLLRVKAHILAVPARLNMADWERDADPGDIVIDGFAEGLIEIQLVPECGTVCCISGWSSRLRGILKHVVSWEEAEYLGLRSQDLFYPIRWPRELWEQYRNAKTVRDKAWVAGLAIDAVIAGDGDFIRN